MSIRFSNIKLLNQQDQVVIMYITMQDPKDFQVWKFVAKCLKIWDLDVRGFHKSMWRLFIKGHQFLVVGSPASPYSKSKPPDIVPLSEVIDSKKAKR